MTSPLPLERLAGPGNALAKEPPDAKEFAGLVRSGLARLKDAENEPNPPDSRFDLAYSAAAHALCLAALRHQRNRTECEGALDVDERLVSDLIGACRKVAEKVRGLPPIQEQSK